MAEEEGFELATRYVASASYSFHTCDVSSVDFPPPGLTQNDARGDSADGRRVERQHCSHERNSEGLNVVRSVLGASARNRGRVGCSRML
jgi:hypothetical protein